MILDKALYKELIYLVKKFIQIQKIKLKLNLKTFSIIENVSNKLTPNHTPGFPSLKERKEQQDPQFNSSNIQNQKDNNTYQY